MFAAICIAVFVILMAIVYLGAKSGKLQHFFKVHPLIPKVLVLGYIIFAGCFVFPIRSEPFPLDFQGVYLLAASYSVIALAFAGIWGLDRERMVYIAMFVLTVIGMICRYLLEFGEVSNTYNFTLSYNNSNRDNICLSTHGRWIEAAITFYLLQGERSRKSDLKGVGVYEQRKNQKTEFISIWYCNSHKYFCVIYIYLCF